MLKIIEIIALLPLTKSGLLYYHILFCPFSQQYPAEKS